MVHRLVVLEWLYKADQDFRFAEILKKQKSPYYDQICFFFHQAAEKYLKAYIVKFDLRFEKQHDLVRLARICDKHNPIFKVLEKSCQFLTPFYFETRYPGDVFSAATRNQADGAYKKAREVQVLIRKSLGIKREVTLEDVKEENEEVERLLRKKG